MLRIIRNKLFLLLLVTILIFTLMALSSKQDGGIAWLDNIVNVTLTPFQRMISFTSQKLEGGMAFFKDTSFIIQENEELKARIDQLEQENRELIAYRDENRELREALNLKLQLNDYDSIGANIIAKDAGNWFNVFTVDRGTRDGVAKSFPVVTSKGLAGMVIDSGPFSSKIITITDPDSTVSARISKTGVDSVIVKGDLTMKDAGLCRMERIPPDADISVGDTIETSGLGGIFPKGIIIGTVKEVRKTNSELNRYAVIQPSVDFKRLDEVFILKAKNKNIETGSVVK